MTTPPRPMDRRKPVAHLEPGDVIHYELRVCEVVCCDLVQRGIYEATLRDTKTDEEIRPLYVANEYVRLAEVAT